MSGPARIPAVDVHAHYLSEALLEVDRGFHVVEDEGWGRMLYHRERPMGPLPEALTEVSAVLADMDERRIDLRALATTSWLMCYWAEPALGQEIARATNESIADGVARHPERLVGLACLPLQDVERAIDELGYAVHTLGLRGVAAGTNVNGRYFDDPEFEPLFSALQDLDVPIFFHPDQVAGAERMADYYLTRLIGNPHEVAIALARLILGGVVERFPGVSLCFPMGGGSLPLLIGRVEHGWRARQEASGLTARTPLESLRSCYFDTIMHSTRSLSFAFDLVPAANFMLGSDYPWDMGERDPVGMLESLAGLGDDRGRILGATAAELLGLEPSVTTSQTGGAR